MRNFLFICVAIFFVEGLMSCANTTDSADNAKTDDTAKQAESTTDPSQDAQPPMDSHQGYPGSDEEWVYVPMENLILDGENHFANMRQLTFEGENAEAYFSADGQKLILQRHIEKGGCDQIYIMNIETGDMQMVSTGGGVTTCSYFQYPNDDHIIYASTHLASADCPPKADMARGYVWTLHPEFDIFKALPDGSNIERLTDTWGYDAEDTFAHNGTSIVYTSMASGDLEIWTMDPDGKNKKQLTDKLGYDGGPFFSWDSTKICWRAYYPETEAEVAEYNELLKANAIKPMALQLWYMNADGTNKIQVTDNGAANFCPFFQPGDERIIYASNYMSPSPMDFNLWIIDVDGSNAEQLTTYDGFDAFPMFSPDGKRLVFGSNRNQANPGDTNIFICDWIE